MSSVRYRYPIAYTGNLFVLILLGLLWFPLAGLLFLKNGRLIKKEQAYALRYNGRLGWLIFWAIVFFPIALVLLLINGVDLIKEGHKHIR